MPKEKTIDDIIAPDYKEMPFNERAAKYEEEMKPIMEKWGIAPWAGINSTNEMIAAIPMLKDMWPKEAE